MKRKVIITYLFLLTTLISCSEDSYSFNLLTGNWYKEANPLKTVEREFSWGKGRTVVNFTTEIDLYSEVPTIVLPIIGGPFEISKIEHDKVKNEFLLIFFF